MTERVQGYGGGNQWKHHVPGDDAGLARHWIESCEEVFGDGVSIPGILPDPLELHMSICSAIGPGGPIIVNGPNTPFVAKHSGRVVNIQIGVISDHVGAVPVTANARRLAPPYPGPPPSSPLGGIVGTIAAPAVNAGVPVDLVFPPTTTFGKGDLVVVELVGLSAFTDPNFIGNFLYTTTEIEYDLSD